MSAKFYSFIYSLQRLTESCIQYLFNVRFESFQLDLGLRVIREGNNFRDIFY